MKTIMVIAALFTFAVFAGPAVFDSNAAGPPEGLKVNVTNTVLPVVAPVDGIDVNVIRDENVYKREPFSLMETVNIEEGTYFGFKFIPVPDEYLLVIETISVRCHFKLRKQPALFEVKTSVGPKTGAVLRVPLSKQWEHPEFGDSEWIGTLQLRVYAGPGSDVGLWAYRSSNETSSNAFCQCSLYGYMLDPDSPSLAP